MRKLATLRRVTEVLPIEGADLIELALIDGWQCVVKKGEFKSGFIGVYFEIDSFLDHTRPEFAFLAPRAIKWDGKEGVRIKSMKLKGQLSQGLLLSLGSFTDSAGTYTLEDHVHDELSTELETFESLNERLDLDLLLKVEKWEKKLSANLAGTARGNFPSFLRKTDQERVQNLPRVFDQYGDQLFQVTQKLDGSSMTAYIVNQDSDYASVLNILGDDQPNPVDVIGVCSRNLDLVDTEGNAFWGAFHREAMYGKLVQLMAITARPALAIQGELIGKGIQENHEKVEGDDEFHLYDIFDIDAQQYMNPFVVAGLAAQVGLRHVPIIFEAIKLNDYAPDRATLLKTVVGPSIRQKIGEGKVFKLISDDNDFSFKGISDDYLLKTGN